MAVAASAGSTDINLLRLEDQAAERWEAQGADHAPVYVSGKDANGNRVVVHADAQGQLFAEAVSAAAKTDNEAIALAKAADDLRQQMAALPAGARHDLSETVKVSHDDQWKVTLSASGTLSEAQTVKPGQGGGGLFGFLGDVFSGIGDAISDVVNTVAPIVGIASDFLPVLKPVALGLGVAQGIETLANGGDPLTALGTIATDAAGFAGGSVAQTVGNVVKDVAGGRNVVGDLAGGNILGAIAGGATLAGNIGGTDTARALAPVVTGATALQTVSADVSGGNYLGALSAGLSASGRIDPGIASTVNPIARDVGVGQSVLQQGSNGNAQGVVATLLTASQTLPRAR